MNSVSTLKGFGYLVSTLSVLLLGTVALEGAEDSPLLMACLVFGMVASIGGMALRWRSHRLEQREKAAHASSAHHSRRPVTQRGA